MLLTGQQGTDGVLIPRIAGPLVPSAGQLKTCHRLRRVLKYPCQISASGFVNVHFLRMQALLAVCLRAVSERRFNVWTLNVSCVKFSSPTLLWVLSSAYTKLSKTAISARLGSHSGSVINNGLRDLRRARRLTFYVTIESKKNIWLGERVHYTGQISTKTSS